MAFEICMNIPHPFHEPRAQTLIHRSPICGTVGMPYRQCQLTIHSVKTAAVAIDRLSNILLGDEFTQSFFHEGKVSANLRYLSVQRIDATSVSG